MKRSRTAGPTPLRRDAARTLREATRNARRLGSPHAAALAAAGEAIVRSLRAGGTVFTCGNGGSAADAQHLACELAGRYLMDRPGLSCVALTTNTSSLTAIANDYGYADVFARQLEGIARRGDVLIAFTTSGRSPSVKRAVRAARRRGLHTIAFTGPAGRAFAASCDLAIVAPGASTPRIQEGHLILLHALCELVERALFARAPRGRRGGGA